MAKYPWKPVKIPALSDLWTSADSLGTKIEKMLSRTIQRVTLWGWDFVSDMAVDVFDQSMKILQPGAHRMFDAFLAKYENEPVLPQEIRDMITRVKKEEGEAGILGIIAVVLGVIMTLFGSAFAPFGRIMEGLVDEKMGSKLPSVGELSAWKRFGLITEDEYKTLARRAGLMERLLPASIEMSRNVPNLGEVIAARWRGVIDTDKFRYFLKRSGYDEGDFGIYEELSKNLPPITDMIHFMVREAFNEETVKQFGYDDDYPAEVGTFAGKLGFDPDWAKRYWRAHWQLPSPTAAYEMLHRGLIDQQTLLDLLKTADYPSYWRDKLAAISYNVLTRVDVRRLLQAGLIDQDKAKKTYLEMGYKPDDADLLTKFAIGGISNDEKDLTKGEILGVYKDGLTTRESTLDNLVKMGYDPDEAELLVKSADMDIVKAARVDAINYVKERYLARTLDRNGAAGELSKAGLKPAAIDRYILAWDRAIVTDVKLPTVADLRRWYLDDIVTEADVKDILTQYKYPEKVIGWYVTEMNNQKDQQAQEVL